MKKETFAGLLQRAAPFAALEAGQVDALWRHYGLLVRWNAVINLTRVIELEEAVRFHYGESLFVASRLPEGAKTVLDVGSGAGFPGFVIAVARPDLQVTLLEPDQRKAAFLREAGDFAGNVRVVARRSREVEGRFDVVVSRAVRAGDVLEVARRCARWVALVGTEPPAREPGEEWTSVALPDGRGFLWMAELAPKASGGTGTAAGGNGG